MKIELINGDCLEEMKKIPDGSVDAIITDPPYGYSFMGKDWDKAVPSVEIWQECLRVLKHGAFACVMSAPRSDVQNAMISRLMEAGFRLDFTPIYWTYASGFPKAGNVGKLVDKRLGAEREVIGQSAYASRASSVQPFSQGEDGAVDTRSVTAPATPQAKALDGSYAGFQPKPAVEVIIVAMKPLSEKTYVDQALKNGKGITWLDDCRVPTDVKPQSVKAHYSERVTTITNNQTPAYNPDDRGRFPANLLVSDDVLNVPSKGQQAATTGKEPTNFKDNSTHGNYKGYRKAMEPRRESINSYSRYFDLDKWADTLPFLVVPKASKSEKNKGLEHMEAKQITGGGGLTADLKEDGSLNTASAGGKYGSIKAKQSNHHPTVKPIKLMSYLITLFSREGDTVLDPFMGSGTTGVACKNLNRNFIGTELDKEYFEIAKKRIGD